MQFGPPEAQSSALCPGKIDVNSSVMKKSKRALPWSARRLYYIIVASFALSVAYNVVFISVISQLEPSIFAFALIHGISVITGSAVVAGTGILAIDRRRRHRSHHTWDWLNIFYMSNAMIVVVLGFSIGVALSSWLASSDESDNLWLQAARIACLSLLLLSYLTSAFWAKLLIIQDYADDDPMDQMQLLPVEGEQPSSEVATVDAADDDEGCEEGNCSGDGDDGGGAVHNPMRL